MAIITGKITNIEDVSIGVHKKNRLTIKSVSGGLAFIEFRGALKNESDSYSKGDDVIIEYEHQGKISKSSGVAYNNLPAISIKQV